MRSIQQVVFHIAVTCGFVLLACASGFAAEATTGTIVGTVLDAGGHPVANVQVTVTSPSGSSTKLSDPRGRFSFLGLLPDTYTVSAQAGGFEPVSEAGIVVLPGQTQRVSFVLVQALRTIATVKATAKPFSTGATSDVFTVSGTQAKAVSPPVSSSGLATYIAGTVQGAIASVPGIDLDPFANAILRGGKIDDAVFEYDSVPIPQGLVAEPGGNVDGAQLSTIGVASTTVTLAGFQTQGENALGGIVDQIPAVGTYPGSATLDLGIGIGGQYQLADMQVLGASSDRKWRYAVASTFSNQYLSYGDGVSFYPSEAGTYGLALQTRGLSAAESNIHYQLTPKDDLAVLGLFGEANYDQYGSPFPGQTVGAFNGQNTVFPGQTNPDEPVTWASGVRGTYDVIKAQWLHTGLHSLSRVQIYQSRFGSTSGGPFWDENGFPNGAISLSAQQGGRENGIGYDGDDIANERHHLKFGTEYRVNNSFLDQVVPTADEFITSQPTLFYYLAYFGDTWSISRRLDLTGTARYTYTHVNPSDGFSYNVGAIDPHFSAAYLIGNEYALRATYDHTTVPPKPLEADRTDSTNVQPNGSPAPFVPLSPEVANDFTYSFEGGGRTQFRATYYDIDEKNRIDVLPFNFRSAVASGIEPNGVGVPTNVGELRAHGFEFFVKNGGLALNTNYIHAFSSSASQFAYNDLNAPAIAAGALFPIGYVPAFTATLSYEMDFAQRRLRVTPSLSYESGYPYGNGKEVWIFSPATGKPIEVPNDNFYNPGANYYFLANPNCPLNQVPNAAGGACVSGNNPYIANLGTPEGNTPNTLTSPPQIIANLHLEYDLSPRLTAVLDVVNLLGNFGPTAYQSNPYLIGPPGYAGGNPVYAAYYQGVAGFSAPYVLGNGVPTNDGQTQSVPWEYGRAGYVPQSYPAGRTAQVRLRYRL